MKFLPSWLINSIFQRLFHHFPVDSVKKSQSFPRTKLWFTMWSSLWSWSKSLKVEFGGPSWVGGKRCIKTGGFRNWKLRTNMTNWKIHDFSMGNTSSFMVGFPIFHCHVSFRGVIFIPLMCRILPKTNMSSENRPYPKRKGSSSNYLCSGVNSLLVLWSVGDGLKCMKSHLLGKIRNHFDGYFLNRFETINKLCWEEFLFCPGGQFGKLKA